MAWIVAEQDATRVIDPIVLTMNGELIQMLIAPAHRNLKNVVQICDRAVATHQQPSPDHRTDADEENLELIGNRNSSLGHATYYRTIFRAFPNFLALSY